MGRNQKGTVIPKTKGERSAKGVEPQPELRKDTESAMQDPSSKLALSESLAELKEMLSTLTGIRGDALAGRILSQLQSLQLGEQNFEQQLLVAIDALANLKPANVVESMLAVQMMSAHEAAVMFLRLAMAEQQTPEGREVNVARASKFMRLYLEQAETMQRLQGKTGQQKVTVEYVNVHAGGQAIVGTVSPVDRN
jgi:hypothetical protein